MSLYVAHLPRHQVVRECAIPGSDESEVFGAIYIDPSTQSYSSLALNFLTIYVLWGWVQSHGCSPVHVHLRQLPLESTWNLLLGLTNNGLNLQVENIQQHHA